VPLRLRCPCWAMLSRCCRCHRLPCSFPPRRSSDLLVLARTVQIGTQPGAAADHLPELRRRPHRLEEHQVDYFGHIDAGVEHVDRSEEHTSELQSRENLVCRLLLEKKKKEDNITRYT